MTFAELLDQATATLQRRGKLRAYSPCLLTWGNRFGIRSNDLRSAKAVDGVIVDHPCGLHMGVADGRADEFEAALAQILTQRIGFRAGSGIIQHLTFAMRLSTVAGTFVTILGATCSFLLALYILEDWVLLTLAVLVLLGVGWTSHSTLPRFAHEMMLLLNLGEVREGERVVYKSVPWLRRER